ncbi:uracil-DNA glycosylase [Nannocystaceae bacterium ST9]
MPAEPSEVQRLARAFARHLEHLREFSGVHYVGAGPMPRGELESASPAAEPEPVQPESAGPTPTPTQHNPPIEQSTYSEPAAPDHRQSDLRNQAEQWTAATKLAYLRERNVGDCQRCPLAATRTKIVFGVGDPEASLMFVGEAPGGDEDRIGEPFVGAAGKRLDQWLHALGLDRRQVYIANVIKCRPPGNRDPRPVEIERCSPFLHAQIRAIRPKVLVALGRFAGAALIGSAGSAEVKMYEMRGKVHEYFEPKSELRVPVVVTYHPSYVLRRDKEAAAAAGPERGGAIKSEDEKVLADLRRALSLVQHT